MTDARTPYQYFEQRDKATKDALDRVRGRLDELTNRLKKLTEERAQTKAHKRIKDNEVKSLKRQRYEKTSRQFSKDAIDQIVSGNSDDAIEAVKEVLDYKAFVRSEKYLKRTGKDIERQVFRNHAK